MNKIISCPVFIILLSACSTAPSNPNAPIVLEQHKNIAVEPKTKRNSARLIKQSNNCLIEFTGNFETGKATEYWFFQGEQLISAHSNLDADVENKQTVFDIQDSVKQANFNALKNHFKAQNLQQCEHF
ncbi:MULTISPECIES: hypothetical protein [unclassified Acinetobacter]|uniref:hypothetical protein n=1 Tax=unclassified Acinetobacter TaxID=196816 RepID=UPI0008BA9B9F|nr:MULTISPECIES: hypothetical protein [unclassified Acinetobacter]SEL66493.1 hypothetical protein SAMN05216500_104118 [Acinetobacter sp. DSM 11652]